jgi:hypothetical protein
LFAANGMSHTANRKPEKGTPFGLMASCLKTYHAVKGDKMFRSMWENGERGTPEQWKIKPKTINLF